MAEENETNPMADLVQHALDQDYNKANKVFGDVMGVRINDVLDQEKIKLADQLYNGVEPEEDEEVEDEQLELDLADQEETDEEDAEDGEEDFEVEDEDFEDVDEVEEDEDEYEEEEDLDAHDG
tara:strand:+ start:776 stop:1144 length:369 start_codon:yes stop_codon:yes gene_type:complete